MNIPFSKNEIVTLKIEEMNTLGSGLAKKDGFVVFVQRGVTGDEVEAKIIKTEKNYAVARIETIIKPSPYRQKAECSAVGCGGCIYQNITYDYEKEIKEQWVKNAFRRVGLETEVLPVVSRNQTIGYRNKAQYPVATDKNGRVYAGFYSDHSHHVIEAPNCPLQPTIFGEIVTYLCNFWTENQWSTYDEITGRGLLRHIYLRANCKGEVLLTLVLNGDHTPDDQKLVGKLLSAFPQIVGICLNENRQNTNVVLGKKNKTLYGTATLTDTLCDRTLDIPWDAFYQVNHDTCETLYRIAGEKIEPTDCLLDLYCGIGSIGISLSEKAKHIVGIEVVESATKVAKKNAQRNGIHASYFCGDATDAETFLAEAEKSQSLDGATVVLDPPRKGCDEKLLNYLAKRAFPQILYISCNPETLARDCKLLTDSGYTMSPATPVDMFPRTAHVETACLLEHKI